MKEGQPKQRQPKQRGENPRNPFESMALNVKSGLSEDLFRLQSVQIQDKKLGPLGQRSIRRIYRDEVLPTLVQNPQKNALRIAIALSFVDSRTIKPQLREALGLTARPPKTATVTNYPKFFNPMANTKHWSLLCGDTEGYAIAAAQKANARGIAPIFAIDSYLLAKTYGFVAGLCYQTTEFPNGAVFKEGIWYVLRDDKKLKDITDAERDITIYDLPPSLIHPRQGELVYSQNGHVKWENFGGTWQPSRCICSPYNLDAKVPPEDSQTFVASILATTRNYPNKTNIDKVFR